MSIQKRTYPASRRFPHGRTVWRVRWLDGSQHRSREFTSQFEARAFEAACIVNAEQRATQRSVTADELWEEWIAMKRRELLPTTVSAYESAWRAHLSELLGRRSLRELVERPKLIEDALAALALVDPGTGRARAGRATQRKSFHMLRAMLRCAVAWNYLEQNPMDRLNLKAVSAKRVREIVAISAVRVEAMRHALLGRCRVPRPWRGDVVAGNLRDVAIVTLVAYAGLRPAEVLALCWSEVDLDGGYVSVRCRDSDGVERDVKSPASLRVVPLAHVLIADLRAWKLACEDPSSGALVFADAEGEMWDANAWRSWTRSTFRPAAEAAGRGEAVVYDLRHSFIMRLVLVGWTIPRVADVAGHEPEVTVRTYLAAYRHHERIGIARDEDLDMHYVRARAQVQADLDGPAAA